ncbi:MAG: choice-of-anchor D domain-containing protein [Deltaproteobacteria bacterium]|nr:choice-of-anchor D domain-containing protein [Deltaproteobacteria bacterium]
MCRLGRVLALLLVAPACQCGGEPIDAVVVELRLAPERIDFGRLPVGARARATLAIINDGNGPYSPTAAPLVQGEGFALVAPCAIPIAPNALCEMSVEFAPAAEGDRVGSVIVEAPDGGVLEVPLTGTGDPPAVALAPASLDFGSLAVGTSARQTFSITNLSTARLDLPLVLDGIGFVVGGSASALVSVEPGQASEVAVDFLPARGGPYGARAVVEICGPLCGPEVALTGEGLAPRIEADPRTVDWGEVAPGADASVTIVLANAGAGDLVVTALDVVGSDAVTVSADALPLVVAQQTSATITIHWAPPTALGSLGAGLLVRSNDPVSPGVFIPLDGVAPGPALQLVPAALHFGILDEGQGREVEVVARSAGTVPVDVSAVLVDGDGFSLMAPAPGAFTLEPGAARVLRLRAEASAAAVAAGGREGTLTVRGDAIDDAIMPLAFLSGSAGCQPRAGAPNVNLGAVPLGRGSTGSVSIVNVGDAACDLVRAGPAQGLAFDDGFSFSAARAASIAPGASGTVDFGFVSSSVGARSAFVSLEFSGIAAEVLVSATARAVTGSLVGDPPLLELGPTLEGCATPGRSAGFLNDGSGPVVVESIELVPASAPFDLLVPPLPASLAPGALLSVTVSPRLAAAGTHEADVVATSSAGLRANAHLRLLVEPADTPITETFVVAGTTAVDVLFVVDNSGSMADDQEILAANFDAFIAAAANDPNLDFHLGVTTTDVLGGTGGPFVAPFLRDSSSGLASQFADQVHVGVGGGGLELGLEAMRRALDDYATSTNAGFLRNDAALSVVVVSDEEDGGDIPDVQSLDPSAARPPQAYIEFLGGLKTGTVTNAPVLFSMVGTPLFSPRYQQVATAFSGVFLDIGAADWGEQLSAIGAATFGLQRLFRLGAAPEAGSVVVTVDGVATSAFSLVPVANAVLLDDPPPEGAVVVITYQAGC